MKTINKRINDSEIMINLDNNSIKGYSFKKNLINQFKKLKEVL